MWRLPLLFLTMSGLARAAVITVTNLNDTGAGSLRNAISTHASGDTINFNLSGTITIDSELPGVNDTLTIDGSGQTVILSGKDQFQIIGTNHGGTLTVKFLTLTDSSVAFDGASSKPSAPRFSRTPSSPMATRQSTAALSATWAY